MSNPLQLADELITILDSTDTEMTMLEQIRGTFDTWGETLGEVNEHIKASIKALTEERDAEHEKIEAASSIKSTNVAELEARKTAAVRHQEEVVEEVKGLRNKLEECDKDQEELQQKYLKVQEEVKQDLAGLRHTVGLYNHITNIRWQYDADPDDIKGYVCNKNNVKPFQLNTKQNSRYFIANYLWDLIDTSHSTTN